MISLSDAFIFAGMMAGVMSYVSYKLGYGLGRLAERAEKGKVGR